MQCILYKIYFLEGFSYVLQIDMHFICTPMWTKFYSCKKWVLQELSFEVGDFVCLKVSPMRGLRHFKVQGKLAPKFIGPFKILQKRGEVAHQFELLSQLSDVHDVFHVSQLKKCLRVPEEQLPMEDLDAKEDLSY
jgi:uncharacterized membrane protein